MKGWLKLLFLLTIGLSFCIMYGIIQGVVGYKPKKKKYKL